MSSYNNPVSNFDLTKSGVFLDERGLRASNQRKAGLGAPIVSRHEPDNRQKRHFVSPFLTTVEQHSYMQQRGLLPHGTKMREQLKEDRVEVSYRDPISTVSDSDSSWDDGKTREMRALEQELGIKFTTNYEMVSEQTSKGGTQASKPLEGQSSVLRDADGSFETRTMSSIPAPKSSFLEPLSGFGDSRFQNTVEMSTKQFRVAEPEIESHLPIRTPKNIKEWNRYLFDQMLNSDVEMTKEHLKDIQKEIYNKLKLIHMGHKASRENTKHLLDMHDVLKAPTGNVFSTDAAKISRGAIVADTYKRGVLMILGLSRK